VLLYELLTGTTPFTKERFHCAAYDEVRRIIREEDPPKPSTRLSESRDALPAISALRHTEPARLTKLVRGELDWIVMKSLEKDRNRRYEAAAGLAADVQHYLNDEPVVAGPPSARYRMRKYARKHFKALATAAAFAGLLVAATVSSIVLASWAARERNHAREQRQAAETNLQRALEAVDQMLTRVGEVQLLNVPQMEPVRRKLLDDALRFYQQFLKEQGDSPVIRSKAASAYHRTGMIQFELGQRKEAEQSYRQAITLAENLLAEKPDDPAILNTLAAINQRLGFLYQESQRFLQSEEALKQGVALRERLGRRDPEYPDNRQSLAGLHNNLLVLYRFMGSLSQAEAAFQTAKAIVEDILSRDASNSECLDILAACHMNMGLVYGAKDRTAEAETFEKAGVDLLKRLVHDQPDVVANRKRLAAAYNNLGLLYARERNHAKAEEAYQKSLALHEALLRDHPTVVAFRVDLGACNGNMAMHIRRSRSPRESLPWANRAIECVTPVLKEDPENRPARASLFDAHFGRAVTLRQLGRDDEAARDWKRAIELSAGRPEINLRLFRPPALSYLDEHAQAATEMEALLGEGKVQPLNFYVFAYSYSRCVLGAGKDLRLAAAERNKLADRYGGRSVELLRKAQAAGYFEDRSRLDRMKENEDFAPVRSRPDFQKLVADLNEKAKESRDLKK
jgi:tetratricopeptide (TPR) repeat protein